MKVPLGVSFDVQTESGELGRAEQLYKARPRTKPGDCSRRESAWAACLAAAAGIKTRVKEIAPGPDRVRAAAGKYYAHLFLGAEFEALGNGQEARRSYEQALTLQPSAQSSLAPASAASPNQAGDRAAARELVGRVLTLPAAAFERERTDPWGIYEVVQARHVDRLLADLRQAFLSW
jgi:tetratricopeptide (TPR) repeat protein